MLNQYTEHLDTLLRMWHHPRASKRRIDRFRNRKLRSVVRHAYRHVRYYRNLFDQAGLDPGSIRSANDLASLPVSSSQDFRTRPVGEILSEGIDARRLVRRPTSGSTGRPFVIRRTAIEDHLLNFFRIRANSQYGFKFSDRRAHIGFVSSSHRKDNPLGRLRQFLKIYRTYPVDCLDTAEKIIERLQKIRPDLLSGFPGAMAYAAGRFSTFGSGIAPRIITTGGESLTPFRRHVIQSAFGSRPLNVYGSHEFNLIAWECPESGQYHLCDDNAVIEVLRNGRRAAPGQPGQVVATGLHTYSMPFVRYALGDVVIQGFETCPCGQPFATLLDIRGRMHDYFKLPDGSLMHPDRIVVPVMENESEWFDQYQLLQVREDLLVFKIKPLSRPSAQRLAHIEQLARAQLPPSVRFTVELVERVEFEASGKFRYCKSLVNPPEDTAEWAEWTVQA